VSIGTVALLVAGWCAGWLLAGRRHGLRAPVAGGPAPTVSVVVPARDEEARLPDLLQALRALDPRPHEVLVVDDGSTDATAELATAAGARAIRVDPPAGWTGKAWACHRGAAEATGEILVFLDADTVPGAGTVQALALAAAGGELVSAHPAHRVQHAYERLSAGPAVISVLGAGTGGAPRHLWWRRPIAFGPAVAVRREVYQRIGGHAAVRAEVAEDLALARVAAAADVPVRALLGGDLISYRMYPEGLGSLVEGWSKNLATGAGATPPLRLAATVVWVTAALQAAISAVGELVATGFGPAVAGYLLFVGQFDVLARRVGRLGRATSVAYPVVLAGFVALFARSTYLTLRGGTVPWRGRQVAVRT
jgi:4,4'-diaponeurosporenoate glycosyltransferase